MLNVAQKYALDRTAIDGHQFDELCKDNVTAKR